jgi:hypothetical protein
MHQHAEFRVVLGCARPCSPTRPCAHAPCGVHLWMCLLPAPGATQALAHHFNTCNKQEDEFSMAGMLCTALHGFCSFAPKRRARAILCQRPSQVPCTPQLSSLIYTCTACLFLGTSDHRGALPQLFRDEKQPIFTIFDQTVALRPPSTPIYRADHPALFVGACESRPALLTLDYPRKPRGCGARQPHFPPARAPPCRRPPTAPRG